jgi:hypothetical protein
MLPILAEKAIKDYTLPNKVLKGNSIFYHNIN